MEREGDNLDVEDEHRIPRRILERISIHEVNKE